MLKYQNLLKRFLDYVKIDTPSLEESEIVPSTEGQKDLAYLLEKELNELGLEDVKVDKHAIVTATLPSNTKKEKPVIGFLAHLDTSPSVSGENVNPQIHENYDGGVIEYLNNPEIKLSPKENPELKKHIGETIITSDGTTLLGADDKAGIAEIMAMLEYLVNHQEIKRPKLRIAFTPDEEIMKGLEKFNVKEFRADYAYTVDGETVGEIEDENFCADSFIVRFYGINVHPGYAKGKLVNSLKAASYFINLLPKKGSPETTEERQGYIHPVEIKGDTEETEINFIIRDFETKGLEKKENYLEKLVKKTLKKYPRAKAKTEKQESYRNMKYILDEHPEVAEKALQAVRNAGLKPERKAIRGGTDGARLSFMGLLTPNIFTGGHNYHSKIEWISLQDMGKTVDTLIELVKVWVK